MLGRRRMALRSRSSRRDSRGKMQPAAVLAGAGWAAYKLGLLGVILLMIELAPDPVSMYIYVHVHIYIYVHIYTYTLYYLGFYACGIQGHARCISSTVPILRVCTTTCSELQLLLWQVARLRAPSSRLKVRRESLVILAQVHACHKDLA